MNVDAHVTKVDRRHATISRVCSKGRDDRGELGRLVRFEDVGLEGAGQQGVVHPEHDIACRVSRGQHRAGDHRSRIGPADDLQRDSGVLLQCGDEVIAHDEGVMGKQLDCLRLGCRGFDGIGAICSGRRAAREKQCRRKDRNVCGDDR